MRKFTLLFLTLLVTTLSYAQVSTTRQKTKVHLNAEQQQKVSPQVEKKAQTVDYRSLNINVRKLTDVNKALLSDKKMNASQWRNQCKTRSEKG
jgi:sensor domain CHASE-containing protein